MGKKKSLKIVFHIHAENVSIILLHRPWEAIYFMIRFFNRNFAIIPILHERNKQQTKTTLKGCLTLLCLYERKKDYDFAYNFLLPYVYSFFTNSEVKQVHLNTV